MHAHAVFIKKLKLQIKDGSQEMAARITIDKLDKTINLNSIAVCQYT